MDRSEVISDALAAWQPGCSLVGLTPLGGGMSAQMIQVEALLPSGEIRKVVARFPGAFVRELFECAATQEARTITAVRECGIPAPEVLTIGKADDGNFLLLEYLEGTVTAHTDHPSDYVREFARTLASIHKVDLAASNLDFLMETRATYRSDREDLNADLREPEVVAAVLAAGDQRGSHFGLRHGDFWPGNILWQGNRISGVIDWENALSGPAIADLSISRLDIFWVLGREAMEEFTAKYMEFNPIDLGSLAYWDLRAALRPMENLPDWAPPYESLQRPDITAEHMRDVLLEFIDLAFSASGGLE